MSAAAQHSGMARTMLSMEIIPGKSIGPFVLGMPVTNAITYIQKEHKSISHVELKYSDTDPLSVDIILDLNEDGILLRFDPRKQQLKTIEIYDVPKVVLLYNGTPFSALDKSPTLVNIYERFGPTHPGDYNQKNKCYYLHYPGLSFAFPIPAKHEKLYAAADDIPPMEFPDGMTPITAKILLYTGKSIERIELPPSVPSSLYFEDVIVSISQGITFTKRNCSLNFHSTTQDVLSLLGEPTGVFFKEEDKMKIHTSSYSGLACADYFYNYFPLGIDILFDIQTHIVKKFILHTNFPSHYQFNQYVKCNFSITGVAPEQASEPEKQEVLKPVEQVQAQIVDLLLDSEAEPEEKELKVKRKSKKKDKKRKDKKKENKREESSYSSEETIFSFDKEKEKQRSSSEAEKDQEHSPVLPAKLENPPAAIPPVVIPGAAPADVQPPVVCTPDTTWTEVQKIFGPSGKPVVHNRGSNTNPFGATLFYGYKDIVFEVMKNDHIASVCLFSSDGFKSA